MHSLIAAAPVTTFTLMGWIKGNIVPLAVLFVFFTLLTLAKAGDNAKAVRVVGGVILAFIVMAMSVPGKGESIGASIFSGILGL